MFLLGAPGARKEYNDEKLAAKWEKILEVRGKVMKALELARGKDLIGNSLAAQVLLWTGDKALSGIISDEGISWNEVFIVSDVRVCGSVDEIKKCAVNSQDEKISVGVNKAPGEKCVRCWNYTTDIGKDSEHPQLCKRCIDVIKG